MGYYITMELCDVVVPKDKIVEAKRSLLQLEGNFSWVASNFRRLALAPGAQGLIDALDAWRYTAVEDANGNVCITEFEGQKLGDDEYLWVCLAPYLCTDMIPEIYVVGEDHFQWRWDFPVRSNGKPTFRYCEPTITWDD